MKAFLIIQDEGAYTDCVLEVVAVCSTIEKANVVLKDFVTKEFLSLNTLPEAYYPSYRLEIWNLDGAREEAPDPPEIGQIVSHNPAVQKHIDEQRKRTALQAKIRAETEAADERLRQRRKLDDDVLNHRLTPQEYAQAIVNLVETCDGERKAKILADKVTADDRHLQRTKLDNDLLDNKITPQEHALATAYL